MTVSNISAWVAQPNTPETDAKKFVEHVVSFTQNGEKKFITLMATDPSDAIDKIKNCLDGTDFDCDTV